MIYMFELCVSLSSVWDLYMFFIYAVKQSVEKQKTYWSFVFHLYPINVQAFLLTLKHNTMQYVTKNTG